MAVVIVKKTEETGRVVCIAKGREAVEMAATARRDEMKKNCERLLRIESERFEQLLTEARAESIPLELKNELRFLFHCRSELWLQRTQILNLPENSKLKAIFLDATEREHMLLKTIRQEQPASAESSQGKSETLNVEVVKIKKKDPAVTLTPKDLDMLANSDDYNERMIAARSIHTERSTLKRLLLSDVDPRVRFAAALQIEMLSEKHMIERGI